MCNLKSLFYFKGTSNLSPGDFLTFKSKLIGIQDSGNPGAFNFARYIAKEGIYYQTFVDSSSYCLIPYKSKRSISIYLLNFRQKLIRVFEDANLAGDELAVVSALTLGYKKNLDANIKEAFSDSGAMHVLAVSGLHVGIIYIVFSSIVKFLFRSRMSKLRAFILVVLIWMYALITGLSPSVTRAALMFSLLSLGGVFSRNVDFFNIVALSAFITICIDPLVIQEIGFWLSYCAVTSISQFLIWLKYLMC